MSYIVIRVYNFECDWPDCGVTNTEVVGADVRDALRTLKAVEHWTVDRNGPNRTERHLCPKHTDEYR